MAKKDDYLDYGGPTKGIGTNSELAGRITKHQERIERMIKKGVKVKRPSQPSVSRLTEDQKKRVREEVRRLQQDPAVQREIEAAKDSTKLTAKDFSIFIGRTP